MDSVDDGTMFSFAHDNTIQQAGRQVGNIKSVPTRDIQSLCYLLYSTIACLRYPFFSV